MNVLLSYPRSGNHLTRFFIELLSENPTYGCVENKIDIEIYKNVFDEPVPFNISDNFNVKDAYFKYHVPPHKETNKLILIVRNPREVLLRHGSNYEWYFSNIDFFMNHKGKKLLLYYEDIITNKEEFINTLYDFLEIDKPEKKKYVLENIDKLYKLSAGGKYKGWGGVNSNSINFYYKQISGVSKYHFDKYLNFKLKNYRFLQDKYNLRS